MNTLTWIGFFILCLVVTGWLVLDWWMGGIAQKLDAAIDEFEEELREEELREQELRRDSQPPAIDRSLIEFTIIAIAAYLLALVLLGLR
jgi:hypothetical protein